MATAGQRVQEFEILKIPVRVLALYEYNVRVM